MKRVGTCGGVKGDFVCSQEDMLTDVSWSLSFFCLRKRDVLHGVTSVRERGSWQDVSTHNDHQTSMISFDQDAQSSSRGDVSSSDEEGMMAFEEPTLNMRGSKR